MCITKKMLPKLFDQILFVRRSRVRHNTIFRARLGRVFGAGMVRSQPPALTASRKFRVLTAQIPRARPAASSTHRSRSVRTTNTSLPPPVQRSGRSRIQNARDLAPHFQQSHPRPDVLEEVVAQAMELARQHQSLDSDDVMSSEPEPEVKPSGSARTLRSQARIRHHLEILLSSTDVTALKNAMSLLEQISVKAPARKSYRQIMT